MRWSAKTITPNGGDKKTITKFAWKKTRVEDMWVWLEFYLVDLQYFKPVGGGKGWWNENKKRLACWYY